MRTGWTIGLGLVLLGGGLVAARTHAPAALVSTPASAVHETRARDVLGSASATPEPARPGPFDARAALGRKLFFDPALSEPPGTSCAACHEPERAFSGVNGSTRGVPRGSRAGRFARRTAPSLMYLRFVPRFHIEWDDESELPEAYGGFFWDGRVSSVAELVRQPLLNPDEMANPSLDAIARKVKHAAYASELAAEFDSAFASTSSIVEAVGFCFEAFLMGRELSPFSSRYDDFVRGQAQLSTLELRGLALFKDTEKGGCSSCHRLDETSTEPERSLFTDFGYDSVAAPRNRRLALEPTRFDLGLCERRDPLRHTEDAWYCGAFRTPSLRNVALRQSFFHNGSFTDLREVVRYYATRGTNPQPWYAGGNFDDLPEKYWQYVNTTTPPYNRQPGDTAALDDGEIDSVVAFLSTLTDRNVPSRP